MGKSKPLGSCFECRFFQSKEWSKQDREDYGECRRSHPVLMVDGDGFAEQAVWPVVYYDGWCGEGKKK